MSPVSPLSPDQLYRRCDPDELDLKTGPATGGVDQMLGQARAVEAVELGAELELQGFNLFVLGPPGTGRHSFIDQFLREKAATKAVPSDWCYVNNFDEPRKPNAIELPAGMGRRFRDDILSLIEEASRVLPSAFESEDYHNRKQAIEQQANREQESAFQEVQRHAEQLGLAIVQTATGFKFVPLREGEEITPKEYSELSEEKQQQFQEDTEKIAGELRKMLQAIPRRVRKVREKIDELDREVALFAVGSLIQELLEQYGQFPEVIGFLKALQQDIADHVELFTQDAKENSRSLRAIITGQGAVDHEPAISHRYGVNLLVDRSAAEGAPVVFEDHPTYPYLVGQIEHMEKMGALSTNFMLIRGGALHRANGGYLVIDAGKILLQPFAWDALKRALKSRKIDIKPLSQAYGLVSTVSLEPEPIPLGLKVVIIGDRLLYHLLQEFDPEFPELFKVAADFEDDMERSAHNVRQLAQLIAAIAQREDLRPLDRGGLARLVEESARHAGDAERLSTRVRRLADIVREAHYWAGRHDREHIGADEVGRAIDGRRRRMSRVHDQLQRETLRRTLMIDTDGATEGQVNGLAVMQLGEHLFGRPTRITARLSLGSGKVIDIEREVELGGPIHSKGVLILSNFLASHYVSDRPLSFSASLVFEQSYGPIEGDSASAAELCALLSALARAPVKQSLAVTGSVNQRGGIQAIGGVNEKIEGFFELCRARGLNGEQGVVIPAANVKHLMLRREVVEAAAQGRFHVYPVSDIDECLEILTGIPAGERDAEGEFPQDSLNQRIRARLVEFSQMRQEFSAGNQEEDT